MISRWCAGTPETWTLHSAHSPAEGVPHEVSPHDLCLQQRHKGHDDPSHRDCCWSVEEAESRDCTCECHVGGKAARQDHERQRDIDVLVYVLSELRRDGYLNEAAQELHTHHYDLFHALWNGMWGILAHRWRKRAK